MQECKFNEGEGERTLTYRASARDCHNGHRTFLFLPISPLRPRTFSYFEWVLQSPWQLLVSGPGPQWVLLMEQLAHPAIRLVWQKASSVIFAHTGAGTVHPSNPKFRWQHCDYANQAAAKCVFKGIMFIIYLQPVDSLSRISRLQSCESRWKICDVRVAILGSLMANLPGSGD